MVLPSALLVGEYWFLSFMVDLGGLRVSRGVGLLRLAVPVAIGTAAAGWLVARGGGEGRTSRGDEAPPWRPRASLVANLFTFAAATWVAWRTFRPGAPPPSPGSILALAALAALSALFAATTAGPIGWLANRARPFAGAPAAALAIGLLAWWVTGTVDIVWQFVSNVTLRTVAWMLALTGGEVTLIPSEMAVGLDGFEVEVAPHCSGMDGMGLFVLILGIWVILGRERIRVMAALLLLPVGAAVAFLANAARIATLIGVGASGHADLALGGLHSKLGWILLVALALGSITLAERWSWLRSPSWPDTPRREDGGVPAGTGTFLGPLVAALATALVTGIWADGPVDRWYGARIAAAVLVLYAMRRSLPSFQPSRSFLPALLGACVAVVWVLATAGRDDALARALEGLRAAERVSWVVVRVVGSILVVPVAEELAFRGFLLPWLISPDFEAVPPRAWTWPAVLLSSVAFGAIHEHFLLGALAGLAFAWIRLWRGRLGDAVVAHALANAGIALAVLVGGRWDLWR